ncbi:MAG: ABC transporter substrate-binding protein [Proteobacteria bacterium]|nr:ABC transporter substrate-binding protein [Pseudomonadota bacterium]
MGNSRLGDFPLVLAMLGMTLAGCAGVETGRNVAMAPAAMGLAPTASSDTGVPETGAPDFGVTETPELPGLAPAGETASAGHPAAEAIRTMAREAMAVLSDSSLSAEQRAQGLRRLMAQAIDIPPIARFVLGRYWRAASERQREAYVEAYSDYILAAYTAKIGGGATAVERFDVVKTQAHGTKDFLVYCIVARAGGKPTRAIWRLRQRDGRYRIIDLMVEGISMVQTQRQEFVSMMRAYDGDVDKLIVMLKERTS